MRVLVLFSVLRYIYYYVYMCEQVSVLEGGYNIESLGKCCASHVRKLAEHSVTFRK